MGDKSWRELSKATFIKQPKIKPITQEELDRAKEEFLKKGGKITHIEITDDGEEYGNYRSKFEYGEDIFDQSCV